MKHTVVLYGKPGCHLCDIAHQLLLGLESEFDLRIEKVDITREVALMTRYRDTIPVVVIDNLTTLAAPIRTADLRAALTDESLSRADDLALYGRLN
jgi:thiol-disulfide isomerase/thioredoxin